MENDTMNRTWEDGKARTGTSVIDTARQQVQPVLQQTQQKAGEFMDQARDRVVSQLDSRKEQTAGSISATAQALRQAARQLRDQKEEMFAPYLEGAADTIERFSGSMKQKNIRQMMDDVEGFARREPGMFLAGAFVLGFVAARFLKSSSPNVTHNDLYPTVDYAGARGRREYASSGPFTGPAHDPAAMRAEVTQSEADYAAASQRGMGDTEASGRAEIGMAPAGGAASSAPGGMGPSTSTIPGSPGMAATTAPGGTPVDLDAAEEEEMETPVGSGATGRSSHDE